MKSIAIAVLLAALPAATASAATITSFADATAFAAATSGLSTEDFNDQAKFGPTGLTPIALNGFSITRTDPSSNVNDNRIGRNFVDSNGNSTGQLLVLTTETITLTLRFNAPITAFGATFAGYNNVDQSRIGIGADLVNPGPSDFLGQRFFGLVSDTPFDTLNFIFINPGNRASDVFGIDDALFGKAVAPGIPEPSSWAMLITGFGAIGALLRRRRIAVA
jgi:hypothetical protein